LAPPPSVGSADSSPVKGEQELKTLRELAFKAIEDTEWVPGVGQQPHHAAWSRPSPDWVLSRQRAWGVPLTVFVHKRDATRSFPGRDFAKNDELIERITAGDDVPKGADAWFAAGANARFLVRPGRQP
jgi:isoleucyl-tRNA synthetase